MQLTLRSNLPFTTVKVTYQGVELEISDILVDCGSAATILATDMLASIGILPSSQDLIRSIRGVGGRETVFDRQIDRLEVGLRAISPFEIEVGMMDYGFQINGILGMDFLLQSGAIINLRDLSLELLTDVGEQEEELKSIEEALPKGEEISLAEKWKNEGIQEGERKTLRRMFLRLLERRFGAVPVDLMLTSEKLVADQLNRLFDLAVDAASLDEVEQAMGQAVTV